MKYTEKWEPFFKIPRTVNRIGLDYKRTGPSSYQRDFIEHSLDQKGAVLPNDFYSTPQKRSTLDLRSTMRVI